MGCLLLSGLLYRPLALLILFLDAKSGTKKKKKLASQDLPSIIVVSVALPALSAPLLLKDAVHLISYSPDLQHFFATSFFFLLIMHMNDMKHRGLQSFTYC